MRPSHAIFLAICLALAAIALISPLHAEGVQMNAKKVLVIGHSHTVALVNALRSKFKDEVQFEYIALHSMENELRQSPKLTKQGLIAESIRKAVSRLAQIQLNNDDIGNVVIKNNIIVVLAVGGNIHNVLGLVQTGELFDFELPGDARPLIPDAAKVSYSLIEDELRSRLTGDYLYLDTIARIVKYNLFQLQSPPPIEDEGFLKEHLDLYFKQLVGNRAFKIVPASVRLKLWRAHSNLIMEHCEKLGIAYITVPQKVETSDGFLVVEAYYTNATHANAWYGEQVIKDLFDKFAFRGPTKQRRTDSSYSTKQKRTGSPYSIQLSHAFWKKAIVEVAPEAVDPVVGMSLRIDRRTKIATAGSCFAQHIARRLKEKGFSHIVTEKAHPVLKPEIAEKNNYGTFSARYGNIYTSRQLVQLFDRAYSRFIPVDDAWTREDGKIVDPFRPRIQLNGFCSREEFLEDRERHFASVRNLFEQLDVLIFTLGLTETWVSREDGAAFPICPGVAGGEFDPGRYSFVNLSVADVVADMRGFVKRLRGVNARAQVLLTVSPVSLIATASESHVLTATTYSKSVLRVAAEELSISDANIHYFPSFEIITGSFSRGRYYAEDAREILEIGVDHVMRLFFRRLTEGSENVEAEPVISRSTEPELRARIESMVQTICDEEVLSQAASSERS